ncbi:hypothetical protein HYC85_013138 [Camellia sinensis]|uniref:Uncharacterized protein n=1 Tax=Camellia sinensis TaxID=4442 RepID=A0A7J7H4P7_CAMSI|nr:hypothetical protein HYC85_013138 [Camellia sinensis]
MTLLWDIKSYCFGGRNHLAKFHLRRPLFDPTSLALYLDSNVLPRQMQELPSHTKVIVEACIQKDWRRRPFAKCLLESPYFSTPVRSSYLFLNPLQLLAKNGLCLRYAAIFAKQGAFEAMGPFAAEMCAPYCLSLVVTPVSDIEAEWEYILLKEFSKCLKQKAVKALILHAIQTILQASCKHASKYLHLKVSILQDSFVCEICHWIGKQAYLETIHPSVISNLYVSPHKSSATAASVLLIVSSEELGVPVTVHQTILSLIHCFGKGVCSDGINVLVRIGGLLEENFVDGSCRHVMVLMQTSLDTAVLQVRSSDPQSSSAVFAMGIEDIPPSALTPQMEKTKNKGLALPTILEEQTGNNNWTLESVEH